MNEPVLRKNGKTHDKTMIAAASRVLNERQTQAASPTYPAAVIGQPNNHRPCCSMVYQ